MPDKDGKLTKLEKQAAVEWLNKHSFTRRGGCPVCGDNKWVIGDNLVTPTLFAGGAVLLGGVSYPQVMVISQTCGYTFYVNALLAKIIPDAPPAPTPQSAEPPTAESGPSLSDVRRTR
jgi:hypothetical protein